ncbi:MAG: NADH-quinone oxidoreductase subunit A [Thermoguttaceae bacterium]
MTPIAIPAYLLLFIAAGLLFVLAMLLIGRLVRPRVPRPEKLEIYECGEPTIGPGFVQFDLRFYVVALVFLIFEVEVAFFFPWATVFGKAVQLASPMLEKVAAVDPAQGVAPDKVGLSGQARQHLVGLGIPSPGVPDPAAGRQTNAQALERSARRLAGLAMVDVAVFFGVLLVGFAYVWKRGDLDWVRAVIPPAGPRLGSPAGGLGP